MYLKTLELYGFKSFPNRTVLTFERGATVIVGPNGSGKSNISDAMRWVLGELSSRNIRGTKMEDVIFGGTDDRRPMGFAQVSVTFDNSDPENRLDSEFDEVTVTRRYYRTGDSEYLINNQPKRLRDIYELFMNTGVGREGYSIIGQGKIAEIISKKSDERRNIFEEAAGISKFRHRKEEAERKLKHTQDNLDRVKDILLELESQIGPLEKEAEKARKGLAIYEEKKRADVSLWLYDTKKIRDDIAEAENSCKLSQNELDIMDQIISDLNKRSETLNDKLFESRSLSESIINRIIKANQDIATLDKNLSVAENEFLHSKDLIDASKIVIDQLDSSIAQCEADKAEKLKKRAGFEEILANIQDERFDYLKEHEELSLKMDQMQSRLNELLDELTVEENLSNDLKVRIDVIKKTQLSDDVKTDSIENEILEYENKGKELKEEADRCEDAASGFKAQIAERDAVIEAESAKIEELSALRDTLASEIAHKTLERDTNAQRADVLSRMNEQFEGYTGSVKFIMRHVNEGRSEGTVYGPLSSLISVDKKYITAIETALGASLQNIVVEDDRTAKWGMRALKEANAGRLTFYPLTTITVPSETEEIRSAKSLTGYIGRADTLAGIDAKMRHVVEHLLLRTLVFDNLENANEAAKKLRFRVKIVTLDGQIINAGGSYTGGSAKRDSGVLSRQAEIEALTANADKLTKELDKLNSEYAKTQKALSESQELLKEADQGKQLLLTLSRSQFSALDTANANYEANLKLIERLKADRDALLGSKDRAEEELISLGADFNATSERIVAIKDMRTKLGAELGVIDEKCDELSQKANDCFVKISVVRKDIENVDVLIATVDERINEHTNARNTEINKISEFEQRRDNIDTVRDTNRAEYEKLINELENLKIARTDADTDSEEYEKESTSIQRQLKEKYDARATLQEVNLKNVHRLEELTEKQDKLGSTLWDEYEITYEEAVALQYPPVTAENREEIGAIQTSCRNRLRNLGNYNPGAIDDYARVKERYDGLNGQYTDLTKSYDELIDIIARLESEMKVSFVDAFEAINKNFGITFRELFGGGNAELSLTDPENVLESGIEIKCAPPGKIIKNLSLLSGGEQSFVAIALLFAILKVNPTPFCILDEIEAALDEVNVFRFGEYIKRLADGTQFILITHRRGTMEVGNRLYGVTMPQRGISQAIELNVNEIEGKQQEILDGIL